MNFSLIFLLFLPILFNFCFTNDWTDCSESNDTLKIKSLTFIPDPPESGKLFTIHLDADVLRKIDAATAYATVYFNGIKILQIQENFCSIINITCPITDPVLHFQVTETIPSYVPSGEYSGQIEVIDNNNQQVTCIKYDLPIVSN
ncbi:phosphatidylglycerol/phosphatidylinositol transfer protein [Anaeramoeba ignava]|uniref:Phosphatidylglycerol/phosphatidylinositol transfer protein n=1 Tax=Anaeramoeba ignava TaxID=1746090 RepID=A0A9Q0LFU4_ANAIG|nr:phosphatidylglycerol/phosphatidylinositol transfer protein [Anaeramoeba ignava]|eukprot:Anaeramoba_ignava/a481274_14.p1 GENE.a481274_14~~a481274_14.p1  ORF type:complete len:145 (+),score=41.49 a481274_14:13-447(+)